MPETSFDVLVRYLAIVMYKKVYQIVKDIISSVKHKKELITF